ncbi:Protein FAM83H [Dissostichus eleginoides]|uniref:Protein FAM83H n=1 Tax=Dissostichus eleginoides TaxID=100907 RepID=A0AAD9BBV3_DISEL|nr:Protein FAM83H [Dissostichus eleginoides]
MAHRSQSSSIGENPLDPNFLPPHYREEYRLAIDALIENDVQGYHEFLQSADVVGFLAQQEIDLIKSTIHTPNQTSGVPELTYPEGGLEEDGSSDTYWPMQSDLAAPGLDLGWPLPQQSFMGPTEVTTLVNPSDPDMPSIKEQARRLIKNARQVIAIVMDTFTDVDLFADLLDATARHVPVYLLLDEQESHHFITMVLNCKVNLDHHPMLRVRTVAGITYYSRTGKSFKGQVKDRFLLADCKAVLSGNYSFMWSYEKIHRCIAHLFLGELVSTFDEEFRILFAQSEPLVIDPSNGALALSDSSSTSSYLGTQFGLKRTQSLRTPVGYRRQPEISPAFPYGDSDRNAALPFRRNDPFRHTVEPGAGITIGKYSQQQFRLQHSFLEQGRSIVSRQMDTSSSAFQRHSYAEGTQENYSSSRQYMKSRVMNNLDETDVHREHTQSSHYYKEGPGSGSGHGHYERLRGPSPQLSIDQYSNSSFRSDREQQPGNYSREYFSSDDLRGPEGHQAPPVAGRYAGDSSRRPTVGHAYACQSSPTQPHPPEKKPYAKESEQEAGEDADARQGMRSWRIHSYLSTYEDGGGEGLTQPLGPDAFEDPPPQKSSADDNPASRYGLKEPPNVPNKPKAEFTRPRYGKPILPDSNSRESSLTTTKDLYSSSRDLRPSLLEKETERGAAREVGVDVEMHSGSLGLKTATEEDEELDSGRTSSIVAQILEKRRSLTREPFDSAEPVPKKTDLSAKIAELTRRTSFSSVKPPILKPSANLLKPSETTQPHRDDNASDGQKKDIFKKPFPSPNIFRRDQLKLKVLSPRRISCGEDLLTTDATDAEKSEMKKSRSHSSSTLPRADSKEGMQKVMGSNTSINTLGDGKGDGKTLDFLKKQTQRLKGFLGPKDKEKRSSGDEKSMSTVKELTEEFNKKQSSSATTDQTTTNHKTSTITSVTSRYQSPSSSVIFSSNLRDDTKVILEQISANSQKNRLEREETGGDEDNSIKNSRFLRPVSNVQEREGLLKRIESMRKEKKVYSRFEMGNSLG